MSMNRLSVLLRRFTSLAELRYEIFKEELSYLAVLSSYVLILGVVALIIGLTTHFLIVKLLLEMFLYLTGNIYISLLINILLNAAFLALLIYVIYGKCCKISLKSQQIFK